MRDVRDDEVRFLYQRNSSLTEELEIKYVLIKGFPEEPSRIIKIIKAFPRIHYSKDKRLKGYYQRIGLGREWFLKKEFPEEERKDIKESCWRMRLLIKS